MESKDEEAIIEAILFAAGRSVSRKEIVMALELSEEEVCNIIENMILKYEQNDRGIEIIRINDEYQLCTKKELYENVYSVLDKRAKPKLSNASIETLSIIAYNSKITRAEIEAIRGVSADACVYKLLEYGLIEEAGKIDLPGKPMSYQPTMQFLKMFGYSSLEDLPKLPKYKLDDNRQIVIDELIVDEEEKNKDLTENI